MSRWGGVPPAQHFFAILIFSAHFCFFFIELGPNMDLVGKKIRLRATDAGRGPKKAKNDPYTKQDFSKCFYSIA